MLEKTAATDPVTLTAVEAHRNIAYPSPFFDIANTRAPHSYKELFDYCLHYVTTNPIVSAVVYRMSSYPVTQILLDHDDEEKKELWDSLLVKQLKIREFTVKMNLDWFTFGNYFIFISFPFRRTLICVGCQKESTMADAQEIRFTRLDKKMILLAKCPTCNMAKPHQIKDIKIKDASQIRLLRLRPLQVDVDEIEVTGHRRYTYTVSGKLKRQIIAKDRGVLERVPWVFIEAALANQSVTIEANQIYHGARPGPSAEAPQWGPPHVMPVLRLLYMTQIFIKAREQIAHEHIVPLRILYPLPNANVSPAQDTSLRTWKDKVEEEYRAWRRDPNRLVIFPIGVGISFIGGDAKALSVAEEIATLNRDLIAGLQAPLEFVYGGLSFTGSSVSLRMLENDFLNLRTGDLEAINGFIIPTIAKFLDWTPPTVKFSDLRTSDDVQKQTLLLNLVQSGYISIGTLLDHLGMDAKKEMKRMMKELKEDISGILEEKARSQAKAQGAMTLEGVRYQVLAQIRAMVEQQNVEQTLQDEGLNPKDAEMARERLIASGAFAMSPDRVHSYMQQGGGGGGSTGAGGAGGVADDPNAALGLWAVELSRMSAGDRSATLARIKSESPNISNSLEEVLRQLTFGSAGGKGKGAKPDSRPNPEQKPPQRATPSI